jgi:hypothetical protein
MNRFFLAGVAVLLCGSLGTLARGQDSVLAELYGQGVHSYFAGDLSTARQLLTTAIAEGNKDPRCFYFRGLTSHRLGRASEGNADFKLGALLEASSADRIYPVSDSLQRVQGHMRLQIEKQRQQARLAARLTQNKTQQARFEQMERSSQGPARNPSRTVPNAALPAAPATPDKTDPFVDDAEVKPALAPEKPATVATEPMPAASDPFGAVTPSTTPPAAAEKPADAASDPFNVPATPAPMDNAPSPFSDEKPAEAPPAAEKPAEKPAADDPFAP